MFLYAYWPKDTNTAQQWQAFNTEEKAADFVFDKIHRLCYGEMPLYKSPSSIPEELTKVEAFQKDCKKHSIEAAIKLISLYEEYILYVRGIENPLHILKHIQTVE
jgi:hypothetical protein